MIHGDLKANNVLLKSVASGLERRDSLTSSNAATLLQQPAELALQQLQQPADEPLLDCPLGEQQQQGVLPGCDLQWLPLKGCTVTAKVSDFGLSTSLDPANTHITRLGPGTLTHTAPGEMLWLLQSYVLLHTVMTAVLQATLCCMHCMQSQRDVAANPDFVCTA